MLYCFNKNTDIIPKIPQFQIQKNNYIKYINKHIYRHAAYIDILNTKQLYERSAKHENDRRKLN